MFIWWFCNREHVSFKFWLLHSFRSHLKPISSDLFVQLLTVKHEPIDPKPDLNCPIEVTERTEVMIKGKKCLLMQNPETKQLCAYPILPPEGKGLRISSFLLLALSHISDKWLCACMRANTHLHARTHKQPTEKWGNS